MTKRVIAGLFLAVMACGGDSEDDADATEGTETTEGSGSERMGPVGCYIASQMMCDCALTEAMCSEAAGMFWTPGCESCEM